MPCVVKQQGSLRARARLVVPAAVILIAVLAGCLGSTDQKSHTGPAELVPAVRLTPVSCDPDVVSNCDEVADDPTAPYRIEDLRIRSGEDVDADPGAVSVGVLIQGIERDVVIRDLVVDGPVYGMFIRNVSCDDCEIRVHGYDFAAPDASAATGIHVEGFHGKLEVSHAAMQVPGGGSTEQANTSEAMPGGAFELHINPSYGIDLKERTAGVTVLLDSIRIHAESRTLGAGIQMGHFPGSTGSTLVASEVEIHGFRIGMWLGDMDSVDIADTLLHHNNLSLGIGGSRSPTGAGTVQMSNVTVHNATFGMTLSRTDGAVPASLAGLRLVDNAHAGAYINATRARVTDSVVRSNGRGWPSERPTVQPERFGGIVVSKGIDDRQPGDGAFRVAIHDSAFSGNVPFALSNRGEPIDARENWWNDPMGPRVNVTFGPASAGPIGQGAGEIITDGVEYSPWKRAPPSEA